MSSIKRKRSADEQETQKLYVEETAMLHPAHEPHKRVKIMSNSGQTPDERRTLRNELRELHDAILSGAAGLPDKNDADDKSPFENMRERSNKLWKHVRYTSEATLDSKNFELIAHHAAATAESLVTLPRYDANRIWKSLRQKACVRASSGETIFRWAEFGYQAGKCYNAVPMHASFLYGPLDAGDVFNEKKRAARRKRVQENDVEEEKLIEVDQPHGVRGTGNELSAIEKHMRSTYDALIEKSKASVEDAKSREGEFFALLKRDLQHLDIDERNKIIELRTRHYISEAQKVDLAQVLFNPQSFTQTVENINHLSFFIRENRAAVEIRKTEEAREFGLCGPGPVVRPTKRHVEPRSQRQAIVSLNMRDWRDMCKAFEVERSDVPHRAQPLKPEDNAECPMDNEHNHCAKPRNNKGSARGMPKTEGLDDDLAFVNSKPKVVTPTKHEAIAAGSNDWSYRNRTSINESGATGENGFYNELQSAAQCSLQKLIDGRSITWRKRKSRKKKQPSHVPQLDPEGIIDLTHKSDPGGVIDLTDD